MPATLIVPKKQPEKKRPPAYNYAILDDREPPPGYEPEPDRKAPEDRGVCIIGGDDED